MTRTRTILLVMATTMLACNPTFADRSVTLEIVRNGLPHDALYDIAFDGAWGVAVGNHGNVIETLDGGLSWTATDLSNDAAMLGVAVADGRMVIVGQGGLVYLREGNSAAKRAVSGTSERLMSVAIAEDTVLAVGGFGTVLASLDGGQTFALLPIDWSTINEDGFEPHLYDVVITLDGAWLICGEFGLILRSEDQGGSWQTVSEGDASMFALHLREDGVGYGVGQDGTIVQTADAGRSWQFKASPSSANLLGVWSAPGGEVVVAGIRELLWSPNDGAAFERARWRLIERGWYQGIADGLTLTSSDGNTLTRQRVFAVGQFGQVVEIVGP